MCATESEYIQVTEEDSSPVELPTETDNTLLLSTLTAQFPLATGLKFKSEDTGCFRGVRLCDGQLFPPSDGWKNKTFQIVKTNNKRKGDEQDESENTSKSKRFEGKKCSDLIVLNLPWKADEEVLKAHFSRFGEVVMTQIKRDPTTSQSRGYGFVRFRDYYAQAICLAERHLIDSRWCDVRIPISKYEGDRQEINRKLHIGQLTEDITVEMLRNHFSQFGEITDIFVPKPFRSFAFITFEDADVAVSLLGTNQEINDVVLKVGSAIPKLPIQSHARQDMMPNMRPRQMNHPGSQWKGWQPHYDGFGYNGDMSGSQIKENYRQKFIGPDMKQSNFSTAPSSQYTRANQNKTRGYNWQKNDINSAQNFPGLDSATMATLNILSNPSVVAAIVNAAKGDSSSNGNNI